MTTRYPGWRTLPSLAPDNLYPWLANTGSMTARLTKYFPDLTLTVLSTGLRRIYNDEAALLHLPQQRLVYTREVLLSAQQKPLLYARSVTEPKWLYTAFSFLHQQRNKPLGATLFATSRFRRHPLSVTRVRTGHCLYHSALAALPFSDPYLWARRSLFTAEAASLLVTEVFLPGLVNSGKAR